MKLAWRMSCHGICLFWVCEWMWLPAFLIEEHEKHIHPDSYNLKQVDINRTIGKRKYNEKATSCLVVRWRHQDKERLRIKNKETGWGFLTYHRTRVWETDKWRHTCLTEKVQWVIMERSLGWQWGKVDSVLKRSQFSVKRQRLLKLFTHISDSMKLITYYFQLHDIANRYIAYLQYANSCKGCRNADESETDNAH